MHNQVKLRDVENWYMQEALERAREIEDADYPLEKLAFFIKGLIDELKSRTSEKLTCSISEESAIGEPEELDRKLSNINVYRIFADREPLGEVGVRTVFFYNNPKFKGIHGDFPFLLIYDSIVYEGNIPDYTPDNEKTILIANAFNCLPELFRDPVFRVCFMRNCFEKSAETGLWESVGFVNNNSPERPVKRHDKHPVRLASNESDGLERELYFKD